MPRGMKTLSRILPALILTLLLSIRPGEPVRAITTWTVDSLDDSWGNCTIAGQCTLRTAIASATSGDTITFSVSGVIAITLSAGYWVDKAVTIDGGGNITIDAGNTTDSAFNFVSGANGAVLRNIIVQGNAGAGAPLINIVEPGVTLENTVVQNNANGSGIQFASVSGGTIQNGVVRNNGAAGVLIFQSRNIQIRGITISSNGQEGISIYASHDNTVQNNYIGTDNTSMGPDSDPPAAILGNGNSGIALVEGSSGNQISGNTIAYNSYQNILISGQNTSNNYISNNHIYSGACRLPPVRDNVGIVVINSASDNEIGPGNLIECHRYDGIQIVGKGTNNNRIILNQTPAGIRRNGRGTSVINDYGTSPFPAIGPTIDGPDDTLIKENFICQNNGDGIYVVKSKIVQINESIICNNLGNGILILGGSGAATENQITGNRLDGIRVEPHYGSDRDPAGYSDDTVSDFDIRLNVFQNNGGAGIHGVDNEADEDEDPPALNANNAFVGNSRGRVVQEWLGAVEVLDSSYTPLSVLSAGSVASAACGTSYPLQVYDGGAWGPSDNGLGYGPFRLNHVGTWHLILSDFVDNNGSYTNCEPHAVSASDGAATGSALFSYDGNASTHPVAPDPGIPSSRPMASRNGRYQVAQVILETAPPPTPTPTPVPPDPTPTPTPPASAPTPAAPAGVLLPETGFPKGVTLSISAARSAPGVLSQRQAAPTDLILEIPALRITAPILSVPRSGNRWDVRWLGAAVGWLEGSAFPTRAGNTVLAGHVWNADNTPGVFASIRDLRYGDRLLIRASGYTHVYEVRENRVIEGPGAAGEVFRHKEDDWLTLMTCEGYDPLTRSYRSHRIVQAVRVAVK
jgi:LPXTG-site transpeptidase (sortase) family protein